MANSEPTAAAPDPRRPGGARGARRRAGGLGVRDLVRCPRGGVGPRHLADVRAEPLHVLRRIAVRPHRRARLRGSRGGAGGDRQRHPAGRPQRALLDADVADHRRTVVEAPGGRPVDHRRVDGGRDRPADPSRPARRLLGDRSRDLRRLEPHHAARARCSATWSATCASTGWMRPPRRRSSACCGRG